MPRSPTCSPPELDSPPSEHTSPGRASPLNPTRTQRTGPDSARRRPLPSLVLALQVPEDPVHDLVLDDERNDHHLTTA